MLYQKPVAEAHSRKLKVTPDKIVPLDILNVLIMVQGNTTSHHQTTQATTKIPEYKLPSVPLHTH